MEPSIRKKIKVLVVEDSLVVQLLLKKIIESDPLLEISGIVSDGMQAVECVRKDPPDVITMDIVMPKMSGLDATRMIMMEHPVPIIIISGKYTKEDVSIGFEAMEAGAVSIMGKPPGITDPAFSAIAATIQKTIRSVAGVKLISRRPHLKSAYSTDGYRNLTVGSTTIEAIAIGTSLGGPQALKEVLQELPATFPLPIFVVQHIAEGFGNGFIEWIDSQTPLKVVAPKEGETPKPATVYVAPDNRHMIVTKEKKIGLLAGAPVNNLRPAVSVLFSSINETYGAHAVGILLTGLGSDGSKELLAMLQQGSITIAQSEETCIAYGMPGSAVKLGGAKYILSLQEIPLFLLKLLNIK